MTEQMHIPAWEETGGSMKPNSPMAQRDTVLPHAVEMLGGDTSITSVVELIPELV